MSFLSQQEHVSDGTLQVVPFSIAFLDVADLHFYIGSDEVTSTVPVGGVLVQQITQYQVSLTAPVPAGVVFSVRRVTPRTSVPHIFNNGAALFNAANTDENNTYALFIVQEVYEQSGLGPFPGISTIDGTELLYVTVGGVRKQLTLATLLDQAPDVVLATFKAELANQTDPLEGAALLGYRGRTQHQKNDDIRSILDFGAVADDSFDDTIAIDLALSTVGYAFIPPGYKAVYNKLLILSEGQSIFGGTTAGGQSASSRGQIRFTNTSDYSSGIKSSVGGGYNRVHDLLIVGPGSDHTSHGIEFVGNAFSQVERCFIKSFNRGIADDKVQHVHYSDIVINDVSDGLYWIYGAPSGDYHTMCSYDRIYVSGISNIGFNIHGGSVNPIVYGNGFNECAADGAQTSWYAYGIRNCTFGNIYAELCTYGSFNFENVNGCKFGRVYAGSPSESADTSYVPLALTNCMDNEIENFIFSASSSSGDVNCSAHMKFLGGGTYQNSICDYHREDGSLINISSNNTMYFKKRRGSLPDVIFNSLYVDSASYTVPVRFGSIRLWFNGSVMYVKNGSDPTSATDGIVVGTQT